MELNDRLSLAFGSLNAQLKPVKDPPMKEEEDTTDGREDGETPVTSKRSHQFRERSRDHRPKGSRDHRHQFSERSRDDRHPRAPGYMHNPTKWTKYDLTDDGTSRQTGYEGLNDEQVNRKTGLDFIYSLRDGKATPTSTEKYEGATGGKIVFKRSSKKSLPRDVKIKKIKEDGQLRDNDRDLTHSSTNSGHYEGSVFKMPEYFIGLSDKPKSTKKLLAPPCATESPATTNSVQLHLSHLEEDED